MRSIERRFDNIQDENPYWSDWTCFAEAIRRQNFSKDRIRRYFNELVDEGEYENKDKRLLLKYLYRLTEIKL